MDTRVTRILLPSYSCEPILLANTGRTWANKREKKVIPARPNLNTTYCPVLACSSTTNFAFSSFQFQ